MSDWDFLHEMRDRGYSADDIAMAAGVGYAPWEEILISREWVGEELEHQAPDPVESLKPKAPFKSRDGLPFSVLEQAEIRAPDDQKAYAQDLLALRVGVTRAIRRTSILTPKRDPCPFL